MQRRTFLQMAALSGLAGRSAPLRALQGAAQPVKDVHTVLIVTKCHLDVGFTQTQAQVMRKYFDVYFPAAIKIAAEMRTTGGDRYIWTTGSWLVYEFLEQASPTDRQMMETAIAAGDICWHALPFSWQTEMISRSMIEGALGFSADLDRRFGHRTIGAKMTDVPGHSRGIIAPLSTGGVQLLDIGVNAASTPPDVPDLFLWKDPAGNSLAMMYHRRDYGGVVTLPGAGVAVDVEVRGDNSGPHTPAEIAAIYARLRAQFPGAEVRASNLNEVAAAVSQVRDRLPVVTEEIGDTWIYGCASDPVKVARYREVARLREGWVAQGLFSQADATDRALLRRLLLAAEHTWGTDTKTYLDNDHYRPRDLEQVLDRPGYILMERSWAEKRADIDDGTESLPEPLKLRARAQLETLRALRPSFAGMTSRDPAETIATRHFEIAFDTATGAIVKLRRRSTGQDWATPIHPLALFTYQTLSAEKYDAFLKRYVTIQADWAPRDFGKPEMAKTGAVAREWHPHVLACHFATDTSGDRISLELGITDPEALATGNVAWPGQLFLELAFPIEGSRVDVRLTSLNKMANRLPEAMWLTFSPPGISPNRWSVEKVNEAVMPLDVVRGGGRAMHAVQDTVRCTSAAGHTLAIRTLDAPVVAVGKRTPLNFTLEQPDLTEGVHFSLYNNAWGTNYPQWCTGDWLYRFQLTT